MARNLRKNIKDTDTLIVHDVNPKAPKQFLQEIGGSNVKIAENIRQLAEQSVRKPQLTLLRIVSHFI